MQLECTEALERLVCEYPGPCALVMVHFPTPFRIQEGLWGAEVLPAGEGASERDGEREVGGEEKGDGDREERGGESWEEEGGEGELGNMQLPGLADFMVSPQLLSAAERLLRRGGLGATEGELADGESKGRLYLQSNVEDVAVWMRQEVEAHTGMRAPTAEVQAGLGLLRGAGDAGELVAWAGGVDGTDGVGEGVLTVRQQRWLASFAHGHSSPPRARGAGWLAANPLPACAHTETEVACALEGKSVYRVLFECE